MKKAKHFYIAALLLLVIWTLAFLAIYKSRTKLTYLEYEYENEQYYEKEIREKKQISSEFKIVSLREEYVKHFAQGEQIE